MATLVFVSAAAHPHHFRGLVTQVACSAQPGASIQASTAPVLLTNCACGWLGSVLRPDFASCACASATGVVSEDCPFARAVVRRRDRVFRSCSNLCRVTESAGAVVQLSLERR
jgi:hypothetical protein